MKKEVAKNGFYEISIDGTKNRLYITVSGFWGAAETMEQYAQDQTKAISELKRGYTLVADVRELKTLPTELVPRHQETQAELIETGVSKVAEIIPESIIAKMQLNKTTTENNMPRAPFSDPIEGEKWLDS